MAQRLWSQLAHVEVLTPTVEELAETRGVSGLCTS